MINCCPGVETPAAGGTEGIEERKVVLVFCARGARPEMLTELEMLEVRGCAPARGEVSRGEAGERAEAECTMN